VFLYLLCLFTLKSSFAANQDWGASIETLVSTNFGGITLSGNAQIKEVDLLPSTQHPDSAYIPSAVVSFSDLSASLIGVIPVLRTRRFFDAYDYPTMSVTQVTLLSSHEIEGTITIKGISQKFKAKWFDAGSNRIESDFNIHLSDFNIALGMLFYRINNIAELKVGMKNPFLPQ